LLNTKKRSAIKETAVTTDATLDDRIIGAAAQT
jgi:hypothetical protein